MKTKRSLKLLSMLLTLSVSPFFYACNEAPPVNYGGKIAKEGATRETGSGDENSDDSKDPIIHGTVDPNTVPTSDTPSPAPLPNPAPAPTPMPAPMPLPDTAAELKAICRPAQIEIVDQEGTATKLFKSALGDVNTVLADIAQSDCLSMYKDKSEVRRVDKIQIIINPFDGVAYAIPGQNTINFNADYIKSQGQGGVTAAFKQEMYGVMTHEINHLYQNFWRDGKYTPLSEGVCDAIRAKAGYYPPGRKQKGGNYLGSYTTTGYFLMYLNDKYPDFIYKLNKAAPTWNDNFWQQTLGKSVDQLWSEYQASF